VNSALPGVRIFLFGRFEVARGEHLLRAEAWTRRKAAALLQRLALEGRLLKDQAIDFLWPDADPLSGANNLYRTLHALRQTLDGTLGSGTAEATLEFRDGVLILGDGVWVDVREFESLTQSGEPADLAAAIQLYRGELLSDALYAEWTLLPRESLRRRQRDARLALSARLRDVRDYRGAIELLVPLLLDDPADEPVHRELMRLYALAGRRHDALRQYQACVDALAAELDVPPEPETANLYSQILNADLTPPPVSAPVTIIPPAALATDGVRGSRLVGRERELETLEGFLGAAWKGRGQTILLAGESGIGKTRLGLETLRAAASAGMMTLHGAAYEQEGQLPYQPFVEAFDRYLVEQQRSLNENPITHFKRTGSRDPQQEQWALFNAAATFLASLAMRVPVVLLVDDLHAADESSLQLFHYLARQTRTAPVILLATYRTDVEPAVASPFGALINALYREHLGETLPLKPLTVEAIYDVVGQILGGRAVPELVEAIFGITKGNPFFVREITTALLKSGQVEEQAGEWHLRSGTELPLPSGLRGLLRERVARLGLQVEATLVAAAVAGTEFRFEVLRMVSELPESQLLDALDKALMAQLVEETEDGYRFRHPLIRHTLYEGLSRARRARLHGRTAETIEALRARAPGEFERAVEDLAFHYDRSDRRERARPYLIEAGRRAARVYAFEVAITYYERALALHETLGPEADPRERFQLLEWLGKYHQVLGNTVQAVAAFQRALEVSTDGWRPGRGDRARLHRLAAMALLTAGALDDVASHLDQAVAELNGGEDDLREFANVLYNIAQLHWHRDEHPLAFEAARRSLAVAERLNDPEAIARGYEMLALACHSLGEWQTGIQYEEHRAALAGPGLDVSDAFDVHL